MTSFSISPWPPANERNGSNGGSRRSVSSERRHFRLAADLCAVVIEARSNVGPISFGTTTVDGQVSFAFSGAAIDPRGAHSARLAIRLDTLSSGNALYDAELLQRVDSRRHPLTFIELRESVHISDSDRYRVVGEQVVDIRDFGIAAPTMLMLRIYPDVRVPLRIVAEPLTSGSDGP